MRKAASDSQVVKSSLDLFGDLTFTGSDISTLSRHENVSVGVPLLKDGQVGFSDRSVHEETPTVVRRIRLERLYVSY
ncbi:MAG: hypothetical protein KDD62_11925, partial [Bdellovibrionales bacterium]|nr:hypothetical protein [Bdellovibrionales bacterium]